MEAGGLDWGLGLRARAEGKGWGLGMGDRAGA